MIWFVYNMTDSSTYEELIELCTEVLLPNQRMLKGEREMRVVIVGTHSAGEQDAPTKDQRRKLALLMRRLTLNEVNEVNVDCEVDDRATLMRVVHPEEVGRVYSGEPASIFGQIQKWVTEWCR